MSSSPGTLYLSVFSYLNYILIPVFFNILQLFFIIRNILFIFWLIICKLFFFTSTTQNRLRTQVPEAAKLQFYKLQLIKYKFQPKPSDTTYRGKLHDSLKGTDEVIFILPPAYTHPARTSRTASLPANSDCHPNARSPSRISMRSPPHPAWKAFSRSPAI